MKPGLYKDPNDTFIAVLEGRRMFCRQIDGGLRIAIKRVTKRMPFDKRVPSTTEDLCVNVNKRGTKTMYFDISTEGAEALCNIICSAINHIKTKEKT